MKAKHCKYNMSIELPLREKFKFSTVVNKNPSCSKITINRRLNKMLTSGQIIRVSHGVYRAIKSKKVNIIPEVKTSDMSLNRWMNLSMKDKAKIVDLVLAELIKAELVKEGWVVDKDGKFSVA